MDKASIAPLIDSFKELFPKETSFAAASTDAFIYYKPSRSVDLSITPGDRVVQDTVSYHSLVRKKKTSRHVSSHVFGVPYYGTSVPIIQKNELVGCLTAITVPGEAPEELKILTMQHENGWKPVPYSDVSYMEAYDRKTWMQTSEGRGTNKFTLHQLEWLLPEDTFIRCHRSFIVNINKIRDIQPDSHSTFTLIMDEGSRVPVGQTYASSFRWRLQF